MKNKNIESNRELPSTVKLIKSTIIAFIIATVILITVVLPAEYGVDPTGVGEFIGLLKMGEIKVSLAHEAAEGRATRKVEMPQGINNVKPAIEPVVEEVKKKLNLNSDKITITLKPNEGKEIKLAMKKGKQVNFVWYTDGGKANFDSHADSKVLKISYHNYEKGSLERNEGVLEAAFDGNHGWFWRNRTSESMLVTLEVNGNYTDVLQF